MATGIYLNNAKPNGPIMKTLETHHRQIFGRGEKGFLIGSAGARGRLWGAFWVQSIDARPHS